MAYEEQAEGLRFLKRSRRIHTSLDFVFVFVFEEVVEVASALPGDPKLSEKMTSSGDCEHSDDVKIIGNAPVHEMTKVYDSEDIREYKNRMNRLKYRERQSKPKGMLANNERLYQTLIEDRVAAID